MEYIKRLRQITKVLIEEEVEYIELKKAIEDYKNLLMELSGVDLEEEKNKENINLDNGIAIGTTWAANCIDDIKRTQQFVKGIYKAVEEKVKREEKKPVRILYAGTGPFSSLTLPLVVKYKPEEIQFILLEINEGSITTLKEVIKKMGAEKYVEKIVQVDATKYKIAENSQIDLVICETMQHSLIREPQIAIMLNLLSQLDDQIQIIPEIIKLELALINNEPTSQGFRKKPNKYLKISDLFEFDRDTMRSINIEKRNKNKHIELLEKTIKIPRVNMAEYDKLVISTEIQVYGNEKIKYKESGLTEPKIIISLSEIDPSKSQIKLSYEMDSVPDFKIEWEKGCG